MQTYLGNHVSPFGSIVLSFRDECEEFTRRDPYPEFMLKLWENGMNFQRLKSSDLHVSGGILD